MDSSPARKIPVQSPVPSSDNRGKIIPQGRRLPAPRQIKKRRSFFSARLGVDLMFVFLLVLLIILGLVSMWSASYPIAYAETGDSLYYVKKQLISIIFGAVVMFFCSYMDYHYWHSFAVFVLAGGLFLMCIVLVMPAHDGVRRWLYIGPVNVQVSEVIKFALILWLAHYESKFYDKMGKFTVGVLPTLGLLGIIAILLYLEPHFSGIVIMIALTGVMMFIGGVKLRYFIIGGGLGAAGVAFLIATNQLGYAMSRLKGWGKALVYEDDLMWDMTRQTRNSMWAIGSGGLLGQGIGQSRQKYTYIAEVQNDFVFAVVCEELGFIGAALILCIFGLFVWRGIAISLKCNDKFGKLLGVGLASQIGIQVILNILVITDMLPNTGISLPFFSYGGSSIVMLMVEMGIIMSISRSSSIEKV